MLVVIRLGLHARSSRARIRLLEGDETLRENALVHAFSRLERELEMAVVEVIEDDQGSNMPATAPERSEKTHRMNGNGKKRCMEDGSNARIKEKTVALMHSLPKRIRRA